ncbi:MAG: UDP-N-acetylmuramate dehydrogenase [bacterium]|nr:UDP-N-acetylmuramate dehydrogenase [bacterium]
MAIIIKKNVPLAPYTTFRVGGPARFFTIVKNTDELVDAVNFAKKEKIPWFLLGGGANILVMDDGFSGLVIKNEIPGFEYKISGDDLTASVGAGEVWDDFVLDTVKHGFWGLENLSGIPGSVGASPVQNVGAYGIEVKSAISKVEVLDTDNCRIKIFPPEQCLFEYRDSIFKKNIGKKFIITKVYFNLTKNGSANLAYKNLESQFKDTKEKISISEIRNATLSARQRKMPDLHKVGTAGSFYAHPIISMKMYENVKNKYPNMPFWSYGNGLAKIPAGWLVEFVANSKGLRRGDVGSWHQHALVFVNYGNALAREVDLFSSDIEKNILEKTGIILEREVQMVG